MDAYRRFLRERRAVARPSAARPAAADPLDARAAAIAWAAEAAADPAVVYIDTETTGVAAHDEVIEIAIVGNDARVLFHTLIRPAGPIPAGAIAVHGITDADVAGAPTLPEVHDHLRRWLEGRRAIVYNAPFDRRLIAQSCARYGVAPPDARYDCAMRRYAGFAGAPGRGGFRWHKLERAVLAFGAPPGSHRAAADALACRAVVHGMAREGPAIAMAIGALHERRG